MTAAQPEGSGRAMVWGLKGADSAPHNRLAAGARAVPARAQLARRQLCGERVGQAGRGLALRAHPLTPSRSMALSHAKTLALK